MKIKKLLTIGLLMSGGLLTYAAEEISVGKDMGFITLPYSLGENNSFTVKENDGIPQAASLKYNLNIKEEGDYILYLEVYRKKGNNGCHFEIYLDEGSEPIFTNENIIDCGGNWDEFYYKLPSQFHLPEGSHSITIQAKQQRWIVNPKIDPVIVSSEYANLIEADKGGEINVLYAWPGSNETWTRVSSKGEYQDVKKEGVLVTSKINLPSNNVTKLLYPVNVQEAGTYPVEITGRFFTNNSDVKTISQFPINIEYLKDSQGSGVKETITGFSLIDDIDNLSVAKGSLHLDEGKYIFSITTDYSDTDLFMMTNIKLGEIANDIMIIVDQPEAYLNHSFVINGSVENCPENITEVSIYHKDSESEEESLLGTTEIEEGRFTYTVEDENIYSKGGEHVFIVKINDNESVYSSEEIKIDLKLKTYIIKSDRTKGAVLQLGENGPSTGINTPQTITVDEGSTLVCTLTCDEGSYLDENKSTLDGEKVSFNATETPDVFTYTFTDIRDDHNFVLEFATKQYTITYKVYGSGSIELQNQENKTRDNKPLHGNFVKAVITVDEEKNQFSRIVVDGEDVQLDSEKDEAESDVEEGEDSENEVEEEIAPVADTNALVYTLGAVKSDHLIEVYMKYPTFAVETKVDEGSEAHGSLSITLWEDETDELELMALDDTDETETFPTTDVEHGTVLAITATPHSGYSLTKLDVTQNEKTETIYENSRDASSQTITSKALVEGSNMSVAATFTLNGIITGIENVSDSKVSYHVSETGITVITDEESIVTVSDLAGRMIFNGKVKGESFIPVNANGLITLQIKTANEIKVVKILK